MLRSVHKVNSLLIHSSFSHTRFTLRCCSRRFSDDHTINSTNDPNHNEHNNNNDSNNSKGLVTQHGDNAPRPNQVLIVPMNRRPIFPGFMATISIKDEVVTHAINELYQSNHNGYIGLFYRTDRMEENNDIVTSSDQLHKVGTFAQIQSITKRESYTDVVLIGHRRITITDIISLGPPTRANVIHWSKPDIVITDNNLLVKAYVNEVMQAVRDWISINPLASEHIQQWVSRIELSDPYKLADFAAAMTTSSGEELQQILEAVDIESRLSQTLVLLNKERQLAQLQKDISKQVEAKLTKQQRDYFLREQLKSIKQELGMEKDDKSELIKKLTEKLIRYEAMEPALSEKVLKVIRDETEKLKTLESASPEFSVTRSYLDWLTNVPWESQTTDCLNIVEARRILDRDHYGMIDIKKRILEFIAVGILRKRLVGKIMCFIGPPGVGKTSIAKSIAQALGRNFYRFSVGGLTDIAEIKGHRRTYIGAMPGKPIQCLKSTGSMNPLILIDEIDKLGRGYQGDPASALLELLDPNQNQSFMDHYLDVPVDFSNVLFVCTANDESSIPGPLRDRMEIIRLSGYDIPEKIAIARKYLVPKALQEAGLQDVEGVNIEFPDNTLEVVIKNYCRESGVRNLEKHIERLVHQLAFDYVVAKEQSQDASRFAQEMDAAANGTASSPVSESKEDGTCPSEPVPSLALWQHLVVSETELSKYLGKPKYSQDTIYESLGGPLPIGVVMGLAWNPLGGSPIFIETIATPTAINESGSNTPLMTGQLGSVMKESVNIAYTFARNLLQAREPANDYFKRHQIHLHCPEGAIEKDGPSAGVAMAVSFTSLALQRPVKPRVAMTGELSLTGKVLPIGGVKEKTLAARRSGADTIILPLANKRDFDELPAYVKEAMNVHFVSDFHQVFDICFASTN